MPTILPQSVFWSLVKQTSGVDPETDQDQFEGFEQTWAYPQQFGCGYYREIQLRQGLQLEISDVQHHTPFVMECCDRTHPIELHFDIGDSTAQPEDQYWLYSSGFAPAKQILHEPQPRTLSLSLHIDPELFQTLLGETATLHISDIGSLLKDPDQPYSSHCHSTVPAIKVILQQILNCPYSGVIRRLFLEGKALELLAVSLQIAASPHPDPVYRLKSDDIERIRQVKAVLLQDLANPPSLMELARKVGLNDCTLKRGFRQVFNTTVFGYLQAERLEQARLLLLEGELNVQQAAHAVGYLSRSHFTTAFRKRFGVSPRELLVSNRVDRGRIK